jgi:hypothetical protein
MGSWITIAPAGAPSTPTKTAVEVDPAPDGPQPSGGGVTQYPGRLAQGHLPLGHVAPDPVAGDLLHVPGQGEGQSLLAGGPHDRRGQQVGGHLVEGGRQPQDFVRLDSAGGDDLGHRGAARRQGARLVETQDADPGQGLEGSAVFDDDSPAGGAGEPGDDGHRGGQDERAGGGHDEDGDGSEGLAREGPGQAGKGQGDGHEGQGEAVGQADEGSRRGLGLLHQAHDAGVAAGGGAGGRPQVERSPGVQAAGADGLPGHPLDGKGLAGQGRFVDHGAAALHATVHGDDLARPDQQEVAGDDG